MYMATQRRLSLRYVATKLPGNLKKALTEIQYVVIKLPANPMKALTEICGNKVTGQP